MNIAEIMEKYIAGEIDTTKANEELKAAEANFHLVPLTEDEREAKRQREDEEGFIEPTEPAPVYPPRPVMRRRKDLAGMVVMQMTKIGRFEVTYDEDGYAVRAKRI